MKNDNKFKITKSQLQQIIKEEYASMTKDVKRANEIKARLEAINSELSGLPETLSEVEAGVLKVLSLQVGLEMVKLIRNMMRNSKK